MADSLSLRPDFLWGASTSAYQIEGAADVDGRKPSIWDIHCRIPGRTARGETGDIAADHYHRYAEDISLMRQLGLGAYRFSVSWSRVLPRGRGKANPLGLDFYDRLIDGLLAAEVAPWMCLYHWDLPQALDDLGGWTNRDVAGWFADYALLMATKFGDRVKHFATFNEPNVATLFGYAMAWNAPALEDRASYWRAAHHVNLAHGRAIDVLRDHVPGASLGVIHNRQVTYPEKSTPDDRHAADLLDAHWNGIFPDPQILGTYPAILADDIEPYVQAGDLAAICRPLDWFGLNHYGPIYARADAAKQLGFAWGDGPKEKPHPQVGWAIHPEAFRDELLLLTKRYGLPVYVTENGCGNTSEEVTESGRIEDTHRIAYLSAYLAAMNEAVSRGADVRGYFVWSLLDAYEWGSGYNQRFGIIHVDYDNNCIRRVKDSGLWYARMIKSFSQSDA